MYGRVTKVEERTYTSVDSNDNYYTTGLTVATAATTNSITVNGNNNVVKGTATLSAATTTAAGLMTSTDKSNLDTLKPLTGNVSTLSGITDTNVTNWNTAYNNNHTHSNKTTLDSITDTKVSNWDTAYDNNHTHNNKTALDSITGSVGTMAYEDKSSYVPTSRTISTASGLTGGGKLSGDVTVGLVATGTSGTYGPSADVTGNNGNTIKVPQITTDVYGRVTKVEERTYTSVDTPDTWRPVKVDGNNFLTDSTTSLNLSGGSNVTLTTGASGVVTISSTGGGTTGDGWRPVKVDDINFLDGTTSSSSLNLSGGSNVTLTTGQNGEVAINSTDTWRGVDVNGASFLDGTVGGNNLKLSGGSNVTLTTGSTGLVTISSNGAYLPLSGGTVTGTTNIKAPFNVSGDTNISGSTASVKGSTSACLESTNGKVNVGGNDVNIGYNCADGQVASAITMTSSNGINITGDKFINLTSTNDGDSEIMLDAYGSILLNCQDGPVEIRALNDGSNFGIVNVYSDKSNTIESKGTNTLTATGSTIITTKNANVHVNAQKTDSTSQIQGNVFINGDTNITLTAEKNVALNADNNITLDADNDITLDADSGDVGVSGSNVNIKATNGNVKIDSYGTGHEVSLNGYLIDTDSYATTFDAQEYIHLNSSGHTTIKSTKANYGDSELFFDGNTISGSVKGSGGGQFFMDTSYTKLFAEEELHLKGGLIDIDSYGETSSSGVSGGTRMKFSGNTVTIQNFREDGVSVSGTSYLKLDSNVAELGASNDYPFVAVKLKNYANEIALVQSTMALHSNSDINIVSSTGSLKMSGDTIDLFNYKSHTDPDSHITSYSATSFLHLDENVASFGARNDRPQTEVSVSNWSSEMRFPSSGGMLLTSNTNITLKATGGSNSKIYISGVTVHNSNVYVSGTVYQTSDAVIKENVTDVDYAEASKANEIPIKSFIFKGDESKTKKYGVIAQDVEDVGLNNLVSINDDIRNVDYNSLLILKIAYLENKIKELEKRLDDKFPNNG